ncbi:MAG: succinate dehydrogenase assembly factor 2 [Candidatus Anaerobiospirillum merdipullorum]|uniref:FAD assembly factor SdhE n=1 Tax=Candidatus Anaerobiospirillum merdipullorum TaxID=2838450 RepID=A0A9E2NRE9_9GAMM|nr:succinate dehydrogenase assembly factor 2 [Candidatus Anaerobiospirillum merdipullorum]
MSEINWGRIKWQSRRGMRELDLMLLPFVEHDLPKCDEQTIAAYMDLLNASDLELFRWLHGTAVPDSKQRQDMVAFIIKCHEGRRGVEGV